jgi:sulfur-oxidizing protein SoxX
MRIPLFTLLFCLAPAAVASGDAARGRALVADTKKSLCLLCHSAPIPEVRLQGDLAPSLAGAGSRWKPNELRARIENPRALNPQSIMPAYGKLQNPNRVGKPWQDKPILTAQEIDDVVAYLVTLT